jgi:hypothetical protein
VCRGGRGERGFECECLYIFVSVESERVCVCMCEVRECVCVYVRVCYMWYNYVAQQQNSNTDFTLYEAVYKTRNDMRGQQASLINKDVIIKNRR